MSAASLQALELSRPEHDLLTAVVGGEPLGEALAGVAARIRSAHRQKAVLGWFRTWVEPASSAGRWWSLSADEVPTRTREDRREDFDRRSDFDAGGTPAPPFSGVGGGVAAATSTRAGRPRRQ